MTHTKRTPSQGSGVIDLTTDGSLAEEDLAARTVSSGRRVTSDAPGYGLVEPVERIAERAGEPGIGPRVSAFMRERPWLSVAALALAGFFLRRALPRPDRSVALPPGTFLEIPAGSRLRTVSGGR